MQADTHPDADADGGTVPDGARSRTVRAGADVAWSARRGGRAAQHRCARSGGCRRLGALVLLGTGVLLTRGLRQGREATTLVRGA